MGFLVEHRKSYRDDEVLRQLVRYWYGLMFPPWPRRPRQSRSSSTGKGGWRPGPDVEMYPEYPGTCGVWPPLPLSSSTSGSDLCEEEIRAMDVVSMHTLPVMRYVFDAAKLRAYLPEALKLLLSLGREERSLPFGTAPAYIWGSCSNRSRGRSTWIIRRTGKSSGRPCIAEVMEMEVEDIAKAREKAREEVMTRPARKGARKGARKEARKGAPFGSARGKLPGDRAADARSALSAGGCHRAHLGAVPRGGQKLALKAK